jgi:23S rRNA pseudouridine2605 synthase
MSERIQKLLAAAGLGSRRAIEGWIEAGRITVHGRLARLGDRADDLDAIRIDGAAVKLRPAGDGDHALLLYHKPLAEVTTRSDPEQRPTVFERLPEREQGRWIVVGRLDVNTSGLLLFTTDGSLAHRLMHPSSELEREYRVQVRGRPSGATLERLRTGVQLDDGAAAFDRLVADGVSADHSWYRAVLREGRNREVRRLWEAVGHEVTGLMRVRYGPQWLPETLRPGQWRFATPAELGALAAAATVKPRAGSPAARRSRTGRRAGIAALLCLLAFGAAAPRGGYADEAARVTTSFEAEHIALVLKRVAKLFSGGFGRAEAERVAAEIDKLKADHEGVWDFSAIFSKRPVALHIRAVMDDMAMVDLDFSTDPAAAARIRHEIDAVTTERGL